MNTMNLAAAILIAVAALLCYLDDRSETSVLLALLSVVNLVAWLLAR